MYTTYYLLRVISLSGTPVGQNSQKAGFADCETSPDGVPHLGVFGVLHFPYYVLGQTPALEGRGPLFPYRFVFNVSSFLKEEL